MTASSSGVSNEDSPTSPEDDAVYKNKQLIAHLLRKICSQRNGAVGSNNGNNNNNSLSNNNRHSSRLVQYSASGSSRSRSPDESSSPPEQQQQQQTQQQQQLASSSSDYLTASSTVQSLSGLSTSPAYVSPFALSPLTEASPWSHPAISMDVIKDPRTQELERVLQRLCDEFELRLHDKFRDFSDKLDTQPATIRESVTRELDTLFYDDNIHWGRVIAVFVLCREMCDKCLAEGRPQLAAAVQQWVAEFIDASLWDWVRDNQGWLGLIKFYRETGGDRSSSGSGLPFGSGSGSWYPVTSLLTISAVSIAIALAATYFRR